MSSIFDTSVKLWWEKNFVSARQGRSESKNVRYAYNYYSVKSSREYGGYFLLHKGNTLRKRVSKFFIFSNFIKKSCAMDEKKFHKWHYYVVLHLFFLFFIAVC